MKSKLRYTFVCSITVFLISCGTVNTVIRGDWVTKRDLNQIETSCETLPRIYSGVSYDICLLRGKPSQMSLWLAPIPQLIFVDIALSGAFDTVIIPYTVYKQISDGNIRLK